MKIHSIILFIVPIIIYGLTLYPGIGGSLDSAEFQISGSVLGISHPTGYPLYHLMTYVLSFIPIGTLALRITFFSAFCASLAAACLMELVLLCTRSRIMAYLSTMLFVCSSAVWQNATITEVYAMQFLIHAGVLFCYMKWISQQRAVYFICLAIGLGIGLAHHLMTVILALGIGLSFFIQPLQFKIAPSTVIKAGIGFCIPFIAFLYFPIRILTGAHSFDFYTFSSVLDFIQYGLGGNNTNLLRNDVFWIINHSVLDGFKHFVDAAGVFPTLLIVIGIHEWVSSKRMEAVVLVWLLFIHIFLAGIWTEADREAVLVPALLAGTAFMAVGAQSLTHALKAWIPKTMPASAIVAGMIVLTWLLQSINSFQFIASRNQTYSDYQYDALYDAIPANAVVLSSYWEETNAYKYMAWSGEYPDKDLQVYRWNDPRSQAGIEQVTEYLQEKSAMGNPLVSPKEKRTVIFLQPLDEEHQSQYLSLQPIPAGENRFVYQAKLTADVSREEKGFIPLSQLQWETLEWNWVEPRHQLTLNGNPLMIADQVYQEGYGIHAGTRIRIPVPDGAVRFSCTAGVSGDLPADAASSIIVLLSSENNLLKRSPVLTVKSPQWELDYTLDGEISLLLEIWGTEDGLNADHAVLAEPRFYFNANAE